jgi:hypothetical protein
VHSERVEISLNAQVPGHAPIGRLGKGSGEKQICSKPVRDITCMCSVSCVGACSFLKNCWLKK